MRRSQAILSFLLLLISVCFVFAQEGDPSLLTVERIFGSREFASERFGPARWLEDGSGYTTLERTEGASEGRDIVKYDPVSGKREVIVPSSWLVPGGSKSPLEIANYEWSPDGKLLLIFTNTKRVWRTNTRGDYWVLDLESKGLKKLGGEAEESSLMFAKFSPDAGRVAYVIKNNIYVEHLADGRIVQLTTDGSETIINGTFDWVYEEEFRLRDGFRWSPDGKRIAYWQLDAAGIGEFYLINNTDTLYPKIIPVQYPKVGTTNSACRAGVVGIEGGDTVWFKVPGDPRNNYIAYMEWATGSEEVVMQHLNRLQNTNEVMLADATTGEVKTVHVDKDAAWLDVVDDFYWLDGGRRFTWVSESDGRRHVFLISRSGEDVKLITPGDFDVISVECVDAEGGWLYYMASPENATQRYLYRTPLDGGGAAERLTPKDQPGTHRYQFAAGSKWAFHTYSSFDTPPVTELISLPDHKPAQTLVDSVELKQKVNALKRQPTEFFRVDIGGGIELDGWCMKPYDFDPSKKYPVFFFVYGEPGAQTVVDGWRGSQYLWHLMLTQQGYLVVSVDNRGTPAPRGREWRKCVYRKIGIIASEEQAAAAQALMKKWSFVDPERIGIWGWSGGGSMTLNMLFRYPDIYKTGISVAPVSDQHYYDTIYQERYMGLPDDNAEGFKNGSPITFAHQLKGNLLIIHGTGDDNVHYQNCEAVVNALIAANKQFSMMAYPNRSHGIYEGKNTTLHLYSLMTRYLNANLPAGAR
jgi:dipeptidyl-peptidase-4